VDADGGAGSGCLSGDRHGHGYGSPPLNGSAGFSITVNEVNSAPVVTNPGNKTTNELANLAFTVTATDSDVPANTIAWSLTLGTPAATGATIGAGTGAFSWTPTEAQGPGVYPVTIVATDNGSPVLSGSAAITITVNEVNQAPVVTNPGNQTVNELATLAFTATATDGTFLPTRSPGRSRWGHRRRRVRRLARERVPSAGPRPKRRVPVSIR